MKNIFTFGLFLISNSFLFSQSWKSLEYQDILTFNFPANYVIQDTLGLKIYSGSDSIADYQFVISPADFNGHSSVEELNENYMKFLKGMSRTMTGFTLLNNLFTDFNNLNAIRSTFHSTSHTQQLKVENLSIYVKGKMYSFSVIGPPTQNSNFDKFTTGIKFRSYLTTSDQFTVDTSAGINPESLGKLVGIIAIAASLFFGIRYSNRKKKTKSP
jgi:hypothetical protein